MLASKKLVLTEDAKETLKCCIENNYTKADFGNARGVRNIIDSITRKQNVIIAGMLKNNPTDITNEVLLTIEASDIFDISV